MALFGDLDLRLDPWQVEYGDLPLGGSLPEDGSDQLTGYELERLGSQWAPIAPGETAAPETLIFVDGVRRIEARVLVRRGDRIGHGAFGSYAVGCVTVAHGRATCGDPEVGRVLVLGSGESLPDGIDVGAGLVYRPVSTATEDPDAPLKRLQQEMLLAEELLGKKLANHENTLVVADGPLRFSDPVRGAAIGYIKRVFELYLPRPLLSVLLALPAGNRTPVFTLGSMRRFARFSWFLRLAAPHRGDSELSGIVRLEVAEAVGLDAARRLADATAALLPRFAPSRGRDPRAPQNLLPIGALESQLRHRLGDANIVRRHISDLISKEAARA